MNDKVVKSRIQPSFLRNFGRKKKLQRTCVTYYIFHQMKEIEVFW